MYLKWNRGIQSERERERTAGRKWKKTERLKGEVSEERKGEKEETFRDGRKG